MILLGAYQLANHDVLNEIRAPASCAKFAERAAPLEQPGPLLVCEL